MPFQCKLCPARFYCKQTAHVHKNRDHHSRTATFRLMFWGSLRDLTVHDMVRRPAFLRGNRPGMVCQDAVPEPQRGRDRSRLVAKVPIQARLGRKHSTTPHPKEDSHALDYEAISDDDNEIYDNVMAGADKGIQGATAPASQASSMGECPPVEEHNAEVTGPDPDTIADSGSSDSDSDADGRSDKTTCYKCLPRRHMADVPLSAVAMAEAHDAAPGQPIAMTNQPGVSDLKDDKTLKDAVLQLTQELTAMRQEWQTATKSQQILLETLKETNKQLLEVNKYYQFLLEIENRKHQASAGLIEQCHAAVQKKWHLQQQSARTQLPVAKDHEARLLNVLHMIFDSVQILWNVTIQQF